MTQALLERTVGDWVTERPGRSRVFERFGLDYCCGGRRPLGEACADAGLDAAEVLAALRESDAAAGAEPQVDWSLATMSELVGHIVSVHHAYLRRKLPRLAQMNEKVAAAHGERHPEVSQCREVFSALSAELEAHMWKEEQMLFPMIEQLESAASLPHFHCGSLQNPIAVMEDEHDSAGRALRRLRDLTGGYTPPHDACNTYRAWLDGLAELEADLHEHIHKENDILFPRATRREDETARD